MANTIWMVRAGEGGQYVEDFLSNGLVAIAWEEVGPIAADAPDEEFQRRFAETYRDWKEGSRRSGIGQVRRFLRELKVGDPVATYDGDRRLYFLGTIAGAGEWRDKEHPPRFRRVTWTQQVGRDALSPSTRNTLGSTLTLFRLDERASAEMLSKAGPIGSAAPPPVPASPPTGNEATAEMSEELLIKNAERTASAFVEDRLARLDEKQMPELVAAILRAMGYKTRVSEPGPDRGVDIFASPDGLGLQEPRIFVEVKHRLGSQMGSKEIRAFLGGRKKGDRCLYVSTGGFTKDARYEADRADTPLTLLTLAQVRDLLLDHYERLDTDARALVPLRRVYLPTPE